MLRSSLAFIVINCRHACGSPTGSAEFGNSSKTESPLTSPHLSRTLPTYPSTGGSVTNQGWEGQ